ncbi:pyrimidine utilization protein B [Microbacterium kribbense]|uniref:Pyrimidine utilization protein B n=1 Tax=Microbacterium kribbense TaxID=433645 RepID=A0ABP7FZP7_9MICO
MPETPFRYDPSHAALVVIDVQNDFCHAQGAVARLGSDVTAVEQMVPRLVALIETARTTSVPVIFVRTTHDSTDDSVAWLSRNAQEPDDAPEGVICRTGSWGAEFYSIAPQPGEIVVTKHRYSAFAGTSLDLTLRTLGVRSLIFTGVATEVCVESSLRDGLSADYLVSLVADGAATYGADAQAATVGAVSRSFGTVTSCSELTAVWAAAAPG